KMRCGVGARQLTTGVVDAEKLVLAAPIVSCRSACISRHPVLSHFVAAKANPSPARWWRDRRGRRVLMRSTMLQQSPQKISEDPTRGEHSRPYYVADPGG